jgi:hypothetical protein
VRIYKATLCFSDKLGKNSLYLGKSDIIPPPPRLFYIGNEAHLSNERDLLKNTTTSIFHTLTRTINMGYGMTRDIEIKIWMQTSPR